MSSAASNNAQAQPERGWQSAPSVTLIDLAWLPIWLVTRIYVVTQHVSRERHIVGDVNYYFASAGQALQGQPTLVEYPAPVAWLLTGIRLLSGDDADRYRIIFVCLLAGLDLIISAVLWMRYSRIAATYWMLFLMLIGSLMWYRIDLLAAIPFVLALLWFGQVRWRQGLGPQSPTLQRDGHPFHAGAAVAVGAAIKLWPALLIFPLLGTAEPAKKRGRGFLFTGLGLGLLSLLIAGWTRSVSPMTWQSDRGLHVESIWATGPMWRRTFGPDQDAYAIRFSDFNAYEIFGPGVPNLIRLADAAMIVVLLIAVLFGWLIAFGGAGLPGHDHRQAAKAEESATRWRATVLAVVALMLLTLAANKTFSPQYLIWFAGPLAVLVSLPGSDLQRAGQWLLAALNLVIAGLTRWIYPLNYGLIVGAASQTGTHMLTVRNALVIIAVILSLWLALAAAWRVGISPVDQAGEADAASDPEPSELTQSTGAPSPAEINSESATAPASHRARQQVNRPPSRRA